MASKNKEYIIPINKSRFTWIAIGSFLFIVIGVYIAFVESGKTDPLLKLTASYIGIPFFSLALIYAMSRILSNKALLIINSEGIYENASMNHTGWIQWEEIDTIYVYTYYGQQFLAIIPYDTKTFFAKKPILKRWMMRINYSFSKVPISIPESVLSISMNELLQVLSTYESRE